MTALRTALPADDWPAWRDPTGRGHSGAGESTNSSIVISNGQVFVRTFQHLWCIEAKR